MLRESLESVLKPFKIHLLDEGKFSCALEFLMGHKVFVIIILIICNYIQTILSRPFSQGAM